MSARSVVTVGPGVPTDIVEGSFEGRLLGEMFFEKVIRRGHVHFFSMEGFNDTVSVDARLLALCEASDTRLAAVARPLLAEAMRTRRNVAVEDIVDALGQDTEMDVIVVLQAVMQRFPDALPCATVSVTVLEGSTRHGQSQTVAHFVTPDRVETLSTRSWMEKRMEQHRIDRKEALETCRADDEHGDSGVPPAP